jgi:hypothetical protein
MIVTGRIINFDNCMRNVLLSSLQQAREYPENLGPGVISSELYLAASQFCVTGKGRRESLNTYNCDAGTAVPVLALRLDQFP